MLEVRMALAPGAHAATPVTPADTYNPVIPAHAGIQSSSFAWTPVFAGVTNRRVR